SMTFAFDFVPFVEPSEFDPSLHRLSPSRNHSDDPHHHVPSTSSVSRSLSRQPLEPSTLHPTLPVLSTLSAVSKTPGASYEGVDREQSHVPAGRTSLPRGLSQTTTSSSTTSLGGRRSIGQVSTSQPCQPTSSSHLKDLLADSTLSNTWGLRLSVESTHLVSPVATSVDHSLPPSLLPADQAPQLHKSKSKRPIHRLDASNTTNIREEPSLQGDDVDSPGRPSPSSSLATDSVLHAPAPRHIHSLAHPAPAAATVASRFLNSAPISDGAHEGPERGWSTAPSILGQYPTDRSTPGMASPQPYGLRELPVPKRKRKKNRQAALERSALETHTAQRRIFLIPKQEKNHKPDAPIEVTSEGKVARTIKPSSCDVVEAAMAYLSATRASGSYDDIDLTDQGRKLCNSFLNIFEDLGKYQNFLKYRDERAQNLIDSMQSLLDSGIVEREPRVTFVNALSRLCRKAELYPTRFTLHDVTRQKGTLTEGHFGEIEKGYFANKVVCIKIPRFFKKHEDSNIRSFRRALSREILPWAQINHDNILPFYGIFQLEKGSARLGIVSPFLENGNVVEFLRRNPQANRPSLIFGVASGMTHLHENGLVHGDIKGQNILVTDTVPPRACLADFGFMTVTDHRSVRSEALSSNPAEGGTIQFEAPELLDPDIPHRRTNASDVYAFSMASYEIFKGSIPFPGKRDVHVTAMVGKGKRPPRPVGQIYQDRGLTDSMWRLMEDAWKGDPNVRPSARQIEGRLSVEFRLDHESISCGWSDLPERLPSW
ncbi:hypothetical protein H0H87_003252, partial [Tephrocybe sp. NHM501043]